MACLILIHDPKYSFLVDLASSITGYAIQIGGGSPDRFCPNSIVPYDKEFAKGFDFGSISSNNHKNSDVLIIGLRCIGSTNHEESWVGIDELIDHEYLFFRGKFQRKDFCRFLSFVTGQCDPLSKIKNKKRSTYIGLTYPNVHIALSNMTIVSVGADALELRVDLLREADQIGPFPSVAYVEEQLTLLRLHSELPIIFTIRLEPSAGRWPLASIELATKYLFKALKLGVEFIDLEDHFPNIQRNMLLSRKRHTAIIASHHDFSGRLDWNSPELLHIYSDCATFGDVVQIAGIATDFNETFEIRKFRDTVNHYETSPNPPLSAFNTGRGGKLSRILNPFLEATTHSLLPVSSAPNQLSLVEANGVLTVLGELTAKKIFLFQDSLADDAMMEKCFNELNLPHTAIRMSKTKNTDINSLLHDPDCGGALFEFSSPLISQLAIDSHSAEAIFSGLIDTVSCEDGRLVGHSCLSIGITTLLVQEHAPSAFQGQNVLVIGRSFLEASPIVSVLVSFGCNRILTIGFSIPSDISCRATVCTETDLEDAISSVGVFSTLPSSTPMKHRTFLAPLLSLMQKRHSTNQMKSMVYLDLHGSQKDVESGIARRAGWCTIVKENIQAAVLAARLRILVDQSIPYEFIRMVRRQQLY